jgi:hypothetical protein
MAFEAICIAIDYDGLSEQIGFELLRRLPARSLTTEVLIDEQRGQELLAEAGDV